VAVWAEALGTTSGPKASTGLQRGRLLRLGPPGRLWWWWCFGIPRGSPGSRLGYFGHLAGVLGGVFGGRLGGRFVASLQVFYRGDPRELHEAYWLHFGTKFRWSRCDMFRLRFLIDVCKDFALIPLAFWPCFFIQRRPARTVLIGKNIVGTRKVAFHFLMVPFISTRSLDWNTSFQKCSSSKVIDK